MRMRFYPMSIGQILDNTFRLYRMNFARFLAIVAVVQIPLFIVNLLVSDYLAPVAQGGRFEQVDFQDILPGLLVWLFLFILVTVWSSTALVRGVSDSYLGSTTSVGEIYKKVAPKLLTIIIAGILIFLVTVLCCVPGMVAMAVSPVLGALLFFIGIIVAIRVLLSFAVTMQAIVIENTSAIRGMSRSRQLLKGNLWKTFVLIFVIAILVYIVNILVQALGGWLATAIGGTMQNKYMVLSGVSLVGQLILTPIQTIWPILLYYDMRIRKEGFDLQMLAQSIGSTYTGPQEPGAPGGPVNPDDPTAPYTARPRFPGE